jgi:hypothetical protein
MKMNMQLSYQKGLDRFDGFDRFDGLGDLDGSD